MIDAKNSLLIAVVLAVAFVVGFYIPYIQYQEQQRSETYVSPTDGPAVHIMYTNRGFEPQALTVNVGTTVEWVNQSDKLMWVASDDHPSHTDLPGFDQQGAEGSVRPLESVVPVASAHVGVEIFRYTFLEEGTWEYHNHLVPSDTGTVVVQ